MYDPMVRLFVWFALIVIPVAVTLGTVRDLRGRKFRQEMIALGRLLREAADEGLIPRPHPVYSYLEHIITDIIVTPYESWWPFRVPGEFLTAQVFGMAQRCLRRDWDEMTDCGLQESEKTKFTEFWNATYAIRIKYY